MLIISVRADSILIFVNILAVKMAQEHKVVSDTGGAG